MTFTSSEFVTFLVVCLGCWYLAQRFLSWGQQKFVLLAFSVIFYCSWSIFYGIIFVGFFIFVHRAAVYLEGVDGRARRYALALFLSVPIAGLFSFKYLGFTVNTLTGIPGIQLPDPVVQFSTSIILPIAISFTALQSSAYLIDVYKGKYAANKSLLDVVLFQAFFAHLLAGPILRGNELLPFFQARLAITREFLTTHVRPGLSLIALGFLKKLCLADPIGRTQERVWIAPDEYSGLVLWLSLFLYAFQIYYDFSAYTDICRGCARLFGFEIVENFDRPYLSRTPQEFWRRWHMSLSRWVRDYLYVPLGGSRVGSLRTALNLLVVMLVVGLWHGAAWTFALWGVYNGVLICLTPLIFRGRLQTTTWGQACSVGLTFLLVSLGWVLFRASSIEAAAQFFRRLADPHDFTAGANVEAALLLLVFGLAHVRFRCFDVRAVFLRGPWYVPVAVSALGAVAILSSLGQLASPFIYFQF